GRLRESVARENRTPRLSGGRWPALRQLSAPPPTRRIPLYEILEERGFEVYLVNARHTKNLPGRKSDVQESQWLLKLHTYGLLSNSFQPPAEIRMLRTYWRQRGTHIAGAATCILRMQKALTQMNVQLANVI